MPVCMWRTRYLCVVHAQEGQRGTSGHTAAPRLARPRFRLSSFWGGVSGLGGIHCAGPRGGGGGLARSNLCLPCTGTARVVTVFQGLVIVSRLWARVPTDGTYLLWCTPTAPHRHAAS